MEGDQKVGEAPGTPPLPWLSPSGGLWGHSAHVMGHATDIAPHLQVPSPTECPQPHESPQFPSESKLCMCSAPLSHSDMSLPPASRAHGQPEGSP